MAVDDRAPEEFARWVEPHVATMTRFAALSVSAADRDDVVQEALTRAWQRWSTYDASRGRPLPWLLAIVSDQARRHRVRSPREVLMTPVHAAAADFTPANLDLARAIARLTQRQRTAVQLHYLVDLDIETTAQVMGCAPGTVKATLHQARGRLRELFGDADD